MLINLLLFEVSMRDHKSYRLSGCWTALFLLWSCIQLVKTFLKTAIQEITTSWVVDPSLCATDIRQKMVCLFLSGECRNAVFSVSPCWSLRNRGSECSVWHLGVMWRSQLHKGQSASCALHLFMCPSTTRSQTPSGLREALTFELLPRHLLLSEDKREDNRVLTDTSPSATAMRSVCPSKHSSVWQGEWTHLHPQHARSQSGSKSDFVSKAAIFHSDTVTWTVLNS